MKLFGRKILFLLNHRSRSSFDYGVWWRTDVIMLLQMWYMTLIERMRQCQRHAILDPFFANKCAGTSTAVGESYQFRCSEQLKYHFVSRNVRQWLNLAERCEVVFTSPGVNIYVCCGHWATAGCTWTGAADSGHSCIYQFGKLSAQVRLRSAQLPHCTGRAAVGETRQDWRTCLETCWVDWPLGHHVHTSVIVLGNAHNN